MNWMSLISLPIACLLGSIPSAFIVAKAAGKIDIRDEPDGRISAAAVYRRVGLWPFILTVTMDIGKAALAVLVAQWLGAEPLITMLAGVIAVASHQWSMFMKFQGGLGSTAMCGAMLCMITFPTLVGAIIAGTFMYVTKRSSVSFTVGILAMVALLFILQWYPAITWPIMIAPPAIPPPLTAYQLLVFYPLILLLMMAIKALQIKYRPGAPLKTR